MRTPCTRLSGRVAARRANSPLRVRRRSPSRTTSNPANVTTAPAIDSSHASATTPAADEQPLAGGVGEAVERLARHVAHDVLARGGDAAGDGQEHAELRRGERGDEEGPRREAQPGVGCRRGLGRVPERAAQRLRVAARDGPQHDLRVTAAARRLHAQLEHAEHALQRALGRVERGDPLAGDDLLVARQQPGPEVERVPVQRPGGRVPADEAGDDDEHQAGDAVEEAARVARTGADDDGDDERDRPSRAGCAAPR